VMTFLGGLVWLSLFAIMEWIERRGRISVTYDDGAFLKYFYFSYAANDLRLFFASLGGVQLPKTKRLVSHHWQALVSKAIAGSAD
jgi:hypothetical protein